MNRRIQWLGVALASLMVAIFVQLNVIQVAKSSGLNEDPNNGRRISRDFSAPRGQIVTADGVVLAKSEDSSGQFSRLRIYPEGPDYAHVSGYISFVYGSAGAEQQFNQDLIAQERPVDDLGDILSDRSITGDVTLTVHSELQQLAISQLDGRRGSVVVMDPRDGAVLAMYSNPTFDPNGLSGHDLDAVRNYWDVLVEDPTNPLLARSYRELYPPGSTFKVVTASAALEYAPELTTKSYPVLSALDLPTSTADLPNYGGKECGGTIENLLKVSCNTGFGQMGLDMGAEALVTEAERYGFNNTPPFDLPDPAASFIPPPESFDQDLPGLAQTAVGQKDVRSTPMQMAMVACGVANDGVVMKPHVLLEVRDADGRLVQSYSPEKWRDVLTPENAEVLTEMMVGVVRSGTATRAAVDGVTVAAKTGTAQTVGDNAHAWLIAFAPAEAPTVAVAVIVEGQPGIGDITGGRVAAPIASALISAALSAQATP